MNAAVELRLFWPTDMPKEKLPIDPNKVIDNFFDWYDLEEARNLLWDLLKYAMKDPDIRETDRLSNFVLFYETIHDLITANYILHENNNPEDMNAGEKENNPAAGTADDTSTT